MRAIDSVWPYSDEIGILLQLTIGIILCENEHGEVSCRIGISHGIDIAVDQERIIDRGGKLTMDQAVTFFPEKKLYITANWKKN